MAFMKAKFYNDRYIYISNNLTLPNVYMDIWVSLPAVILITALDLEMIRIKSRMSLQGK